MHFHTCLTQLTSSALFRKSFFCNPAELEQNTQQSMRRLTELKRCFLISRADGNISAVNIVRY